jgi:hypothetical protein
MFFQAIDLAYYANFTAKQQLLTFSVNPNAPLGTYLGNQSVPEGPSAFVVTPTYAPVDLSQPLGLTGLPTFKASLSGVPTQLNPYYLIDF